MKKCFELRKDSILTDYSDNLLYLQKVRIENNKA